MDAFNEALVYKLCCDLGISCAEYYEIFIVYFDKELQRPILAPTVITKIFGGELVHYRDVRNIKNLGSVNHELIDLTDTFPEAKQGIHDMLLVDHLIGQLDRHSKNFGMVGDRMSPLFDSGACLDYDGSLVEGVEVWSKYFGTSNLDILKFYLTNVFCPTSVILETDLQFGGEFERRLDNARHLYATIM